MSVAQQLRRAVSLSGILAILSLVLLGLLTTLVVNLGRVLGYARLSTLLTADEVQSLETLRIVDGALIAIPVAIFLMCMGDLGKTATQLYTAPQKVVLKQAMKQASGATGPVRRRPLIFGSLFIVLSSGVIAALIVTARAFQSLLTKSLPTDFPVDRAKLETLRLIAWYTLILPGLVVVVSVALLIHALKTKAD